MKPFLKKITVAMAAGSCLLLTGLAMPAHSEDASIVQAIQQAPDPSSVIQAFANGISVHPNDPRILEAYVSRMAQLGVPEMAFQQAQTLTSTDPNYPLAWAIVAHVDLRRGLAPQAIVDAETAASLAPNDVFVQRTAAEVVAWYDVHGNQAALADDTRKDVNLLRKQCGNQAAYQQAYSLASQAWQNQPVQQPQGVQPQAQVVTPDQQQYTTAPDNQSYQTYPAPNYGYYGGYNYPYYDYPGWVGVGVAPDWWWWPTPTFGFGFYPHYGWGGRYYGGHWGGYYGGHGYVGGRGGFGGFHGTSRGGGHGGGRR